MNFTRNQWALIAACVVVGLVATWVLLSAQAFFYVLGHLSFVITFLAFAQNDLIHLRLISMASLTVGLVYNSYVNANMPEGQNLYPVLFWMSIFFVQNVTNSIREIRRSLEVPIPALERILHAASFPAMHSRDWVFLRSKAEVRTVKQGEHLLRRGDSTDGLQLLVRGIVKEIRDDQAPIFRRTGTFWGELTWVLGRDMFDASPCDAVVVSGDAEIWHWSYVKLDALVKGNDRMMSSLKDGFIRSACYKHGLLVVRTDDAEPLVQPAIRRSELCSQRTLTAQSAVV